MWQVSTVELPKNLLVVSVQHSLIQEASINRLSLELCYKNIFVNLLHQMICVSNTGEVSGDIYEQNDQ